jgi:hypothetical protein
MTICAQAAQHQLACSWGISLTGRFVLAGGVQLPAIPVSPETRSNAKKQREKCFFISMVPRENSYARRSFSQPGNRMNTGMTLNDAQPHAYPNLSPVSASQCLEVKPIERTILV